VSSRFICIPRYGNWSTLDVIEIPRSRSMSIQSGDGGRATALRFDRAGELDRSPVQEELLGERRLAGAPGAR